MADPSAIEKTERLLQQLRYDEGSPAREAALLRQLESVSIAFQSPLEIASFSNKKARPHPLVIRLALKH